MNQKPAHEIRNGSIKATIWLNDSKGKPRHTVTVNRSFKSGDAWRQSGSFHRSDISKLITTLTEAEAWIALIEPTAAE
ncbi:hypothetical protein FEM03_08120 [Phragmitibacter flavus]|uniref:Uncharacterized protein n=1 Tax=Phragmitibacter flavus TaxID=2576071 RepID=A0A5R8KGW7_9BACT|nr:hypothetical protein [Phragmitibacter flavus]TLD71481.1 hypothetical protein FEM03_08120 [Phragmitibacter flavus]